MNTTLPWSHFIPLDKSWIIRMGVLDMLSGYATTDSFLSSQDALCDDLLALRGLAKNWYTSDEPINLGESGTLYRILQFASWKMGPPKTFVREGTLKTRSMCNDPSIVTWSQRELLKLDKGTSQWASAAALLGDSERLSDAPFKLAVTYEAVSHWNERRDADKVWEPRLDETIENQAKTFTLLRSGQAVKFVPQQAEDYCFARALGYITKKEGEARWPNLRGHESDRIAEMETELATAKRRGRIFSKDHRVVQAVAMFLKLNNIEAKVEHPNAVNKSWPRFWDFLSACL